MAEMIDEMDGEKDIGEVEISMHALDGNMSASTLKVRGKVDKESLLILIAIHNFFDFQVTKELGCRIMRAPPLAIIVGNDHKMVSKFKCVIL